MRLGAAALACCAVLLVPVTAVAAPQKVDGTSAAFAGSIGVGVHNYYPDTAYDDKARVKQLLLELGVKHLRGGVLRGRPAREYEAMRALSDAGLKWTYITGRPDPRHDPNNFVQAWAALTDPAILGGTAEALEGPNEWDDRASDHWYWGPADPMWKENLYAYMAQTYAGFKADPRFTQMKHYGPSFIHNHHREAYAALPGASQFMDAPNAHIYPGGRKPEDAIASQVTDVAKDFGDENRKPIVSESGYHNAINQGNWWHFGVSERAQSIYTLRIFLAAFAARAPRTFIYQFMDLKPDPAKTDQEKSFGLVATEGDPAQSAQPTWTTRKKPAFDSLKELIEITSDTEAIGQPSRLDYTVSGGPAGMRKLLLSRSDGSFDLVLWNSASVYNEPTPGDCNDPRIPSDVKPQDRCNYARAHFSTDNGDAYPADVQATINLAQPATVRTERPHSEREFTLRGWGRTFTVDVGADPVFVRISPSKYARAVLANNPLAYLRLDETSGAPVDSAGYGATPQPWVAAPTYGRPGAVGDENPAVRVQGNARSTVRLPLSVNTMTGATVELWVKPDPAVPNFVEFLQADSPDHRVKMRTYIPHDGRWWGSTYGSRPGAQGEMIFDRFAYGQWHHVVLTMAAGNSTTYLDGRRVGDTTGGELFSLSQFTLGARDGFVGDLDELAVYPTVLTQGQVCAHYRAAGGSC